MLFNVTYNERSRGWKWRRLAKWTACLCLAATCMCYGDVTFCGRREELRGNWGGRLRRWQACLLNMMNVTLTDLNHSANCLAYPGLINQSWQLHHRFFWKHTFSFSLQTKASLPARWGMQTLCICWFYSWHIEYHEKFAINFVHQSVEWHRLLLDALFTQA